MNATVNVSDDSAAESLGDGEGLFCKDPSKQHSSGFKTRDKILFFYRMISRSFNFVIVTCDRTNYVKGL